MAGEKTEKATPKKKEEARKKGQVARSTDLSGAVVLLASLVALGAAGPGMCERLAACMRRTIALASDPEVVEAGTIGAVLLACGKDVLLAVAPIAGVCMVAGVVSYAVQVGIKPMPQSIKPDPKKLNPVTGAKNIFGQHALVEGVKSVTKVSVVGAIVAAALLPKLDEVGTLMGFSPLSLSIALGEEIRGMAWRAAGAYVVIGLADFAWQRYRHEKQLRMDIQEVKEEFKQQGLPPEVRAAMRRRQMAAARARMMAAVPEADVVITNPTHYSVALKYDGSSLAPQVIAKGQDLVALRIRELARDAGVPVVPEPPLARALHASVEVGEEIPEELYVAVAQVLAWVFRTRPRRAA
ncbi:flagellar biosynthesis protein FlhB [Conexibacter sp. SYSU D00693]|uniref:flagellar biosynthesis protein FlhB n=1 Tax=Conexibacter sp. SYSU D00693 TaxID=2812560 RepID=UPI00196A8D4C|nr:flagellar biosynthesis protein FlhB [Conexibacter sp. SYSU D00693]